ncbi:Hypothetical predicted protein [Lecanosticta acicola]|uniref:Extracellular membrane protein CFEM domain-containing protein n=1 Tax=Lecanosticta acicola TaxID=111012 RepID=A0AAI9EAM8_9PEZI|nr:Hypothetical predicted protein [Lecanosticta acicola]
MKSAIYASALLSTLAAAKPQWGGPHGNGNGNGNGNGASWGNGGPWAAFPSCVSSCRNNNIDWSNSTGLCSNQSAINQLNGCIDSSSCNNNDKNSVRQTIAQLCVNAGTTITQAPYNTISVTSGGSAWPTQWTTNSAWASAVSAWDDGNGNGNGGADGWHGGSFGPFGQGGPGDGWGPGPWASSGAWTSGPWTSWWGTDACPASTWSGWTNGPWGTSAPWTTWSGCTATTTASNVYTTTYTTSGVQTTSVATSFGIRVAEATESSSSSSSNNGGTSTSGSGAAPTNFAAVAGSAAGVVGVLAGAILL